MSTMNNVMAPLGIALGVIAVGAVLTLLPPWALLAGTVLLVMWLSLTRTGRQTWSVLETGLTTLPKRLGSSAVVVVGIMGVVGVLVAILAMGKGFERTLQQTGSEDTAIVLNVGAYSETGSSLSHDTVALISQAPQILKDELRQPIASAEQLVTAALPKKSTGLDASVGMRGVGQRIWELWPHVKIIAGRKFAPGLRELVVGKGAHEKFSGLDIGSVLSFDGQSWTIVGLFDSADAYNSELWGDTQVLASVYRRGATANSLKVRLTDTRAFDTFKAHLQSDPRVKVNVQTTRQYYSQQSEAIARMIRIVGAAVGAIMAVGAMFGALNATYMAVAGRTREIATLRAIGFRRVPVIGSLLIETMLLAAVGGAGGAALTWLLFDGFTAATSGSGGQIVFAFEVSPQLLWNGIKWALAIGFIGGAFPAIRAARVPVTAALREV